MAVSALLVTTIPRVEFGGPSYIFWQGNFWNFFIYLFIPFRYSATETDGDQHQRQQTMRANHAVF
jgi:hypothetical protein